MHLPGIKIYFQYILHKRQYVYMKECDQYIENLNLLLFNRKKEDIIFISSNSFRIITAIKEGFITIPVLQYETCHCHDY